jgi:hypothetical protein
MSTQLAEQLTELEALVGQTIKAVISSPNGHAQDKRPADYVIVTESGSWLAMSCGDDFNNPTIQVDGLSYACRQRQLLDYLTPLDLFQAGLINKAERDLIDERETIEKGKIKAEKIARLLQEISDLEGGAA